MSGPVSSQYLGEAAGLNTEAKFRLTSRLKQPKRNRNEIETKPKQNQNISGWTTTCGGAFPYTGLVLRCLCYAHAAAPVTWKIHSGMNDTCCIRTVETCWEFTSSFLCSFNEPEDRSAFLLISLAYSAPWSEKQHKVRLFNGLQRHLAEVNRMITGVVMEREARLREGMRMMGMRSSAFYASWVVTYVSWSSALHLFVRVFQRNSLAFGDVSWSLTFSIGQITSCLRSCCICLWSPGWCSCCPLERSCHGAVPRCCSFGSCTLAVQQLVKWLTALSHCKHKEFLWKDIRNIQKERQAARSDTLA